MRGRGGFGVCAEDGWANGLRVAGVAVCATAHCGALACLWGLTCLLGGLPIGRSNG